MPSLCQNAHTNEQKLTANSVSGSMSVLIQREVSAALKRRSLGFGVEGQCLPKASVGHLSAYITASHE